MAEHYTHESKRLINAAANQLYVELGRQHRHLFEKTFGALMGQFNTLIRRAQKDIADRDAKIADLTKQLATANANTPDADDLQAMVDETKRQADEDAATAPAPVTPPAQ